MKILLITPPYHSGVVESAGKWPPLHLLYLAGALSDTGHEVIVYDAMSKDHTLSDIAETIRQVDPDVVGIGAYTPTIDSCLKVLSVAKRNNNNCVTVLGGVHPTFCYSELLVSDSEIIDFIVAGEGERTFSELVKMIDKNKELSDPSVFSDIKGIAFNDNGKVIFTGKRSVETDLDLVEPAWHLLDWEDYPFYVLPEGKLASVSTSRGCTHECTFCSQTKLWDGSWRGLSPEAVINHIKTLKTVYGRNTFLITDEYPTYEAERWERILDLLIDEDLDCHFLMETRAEDIVRDAKIIWKYRKAGIIHIFIGLETTDQKALDAYKKEMTVEQSKKAIALVHHHGIVTETSIIVGLPDETQLSIRQKLNGVKELAPDFAHFLNIMPWPYAEIYKELSPYIVEKDLSKYNYTNPIVVPENLTAEEISAEIMKCYMDFYMWQIGRWTEEKDEFKKRYLFRAIKEITQRSFLRDKKGGAQAMPQVVLETLKNLGIC